MVVFKFDLAEARAQYQRSTSLVKESTIFGILLKMILFLSLKKVEII